MYNSKVDFQMRANIFLRRVFFTPQKFWLLSPNLQQSSGNIFAIVESKLKPYERGWNPHVMIFTNKLMLVRIIIENWKLMGH